MGSEDIGTGQAEVGALPSREAEVVVRALNLREGPGTNFKLIRAIGQGTRLEVLAQHGDWLHVRLKGSNGLQGFVAAQYVRFITGITLEGYLIEEPMLMQAKLEPSRTIPAQTPNTNNAIVARIWNRYGGLIALLSDLLAIPRASIVAVLAVESGGEAFAPDGRMIIRFENHIFFRQWGRNNPTLFDQHFAFDRARTWLGHMWRPDIRSPWISFHGNQSLEWQVFNFARGLAEEAALFSISMGAPQVMGFNYRALGYESVLTMFNRFSTSIHAQLLGVFDFVKGPGATSPALQALQRRDFLTFASFYNGSARAPVYRDRLERFVSIFNRLITLS